MKNFIFGLFSLCFSLMLASCDWVRSSLDVPTVDSVYTMIDSKIQADTVLPQYTTVAEFIQSLQTDAYEAQVNNLVQSLDPKVVEQVATVCVNKHGFVNKYIFFKEYSDYKDGVYQYIGDSGLPAEPSVEESQTTPPNGQPSTPEVNKNGDSLKSAAPNDRSFTITVH